MGLPCPANGLRRPIIGRWVAVGVKDFRLKISHERFNFGAGICPAKNGKVAGEVLRQINGAGARTAGGALKKRVIGIGEELRLVGPQENRPDGRLRVLA